MRTRSKKFSAGMLFLTATLMLGACGEAVQPANQGAAQATATNSPATTAPATNAPATIAPATNPATVVTTVTSEGTATALDEPLPEALAKANQNPAQVELVQSGVPEFQAQNKANHSVVYIVVRGDTLSALAWTYGTTVDAIVKANGLASANVIYAGQRLVIPVGKPDTRPDLYYLVQPGDTVSALARKFGTSVKAIVDANNLSNPDALKIGQRLLIPGATNPGNVTKVYIVQRGDNLYRIATFYGTTVPKIASDNSISNPNRIYVGQRLVIKL